MTDIITLTDNAVKQITKIIDNEDSKIFKISVKGGGCSGFSYEFSLVDDSDRKDHKVKCGDFFILVDDMSVPFLKGSKLDYIISLVASEFQISNPNAASSCGCGVSFSI